MVAGCKPTFHVPHPCALHQAHPGGPCPPHGPMPLSEVAGAGTIAILHPPPLRQALSVRKPQPLLQRDVSHDASLGAQVQSGSLRLWCQVFMHGLSTCTRSALRPRALNLRLQNQEVYKWDTPNGMHICAVDLQVSWLPRSCSSAQSAEMHAGK